MRSGLLPIKIISKSSIKPLPTIFSPDNKLIKLFVRVIAGFQQPHSIKFINIVNIRAFVKRDSSSTKSHQKTKKVRSNKAARQNSARPMKCMKGGSTIIKVVEVAGNVNFPIFKWKKLVFAYFTSQISH